MKSIPELAGAGNAGLGRLYRLPPSGDGTSTIDGAWALPFGTFGPSPPPQPGSARVPAAAATPARKLRRSKPRPLVPLLITIDSLWLADPGVRCTRRFAADWNISTDAVAQSGPPPSVEIFVSAEAGCENHLQYSFTNTGRNIEVRRVRLA